LDAFCKRLWIAVELLADGLERERIERLRVLGRQLELPLVASGDVHMHCRERRALQDTVTAIRLGTTLDQAGFALYPNGERYLRSRSCLASIYPEEFRQQALNVAGMIDFSLDELHYEYPDELLPEGETAPGYLRKLTKEGMRRRWPEGAPP